MYPTIDSLQAMDRLDPACVDASLLSMRYP